VNWGCIDQSTFENGWKSSEFDWLDLSKGLDRITKARNDFGDISEEKERRK
jgi:hypothetical protein